MVCLKVKRGREWHVFKSDPTLPGVFMKHVCILTPSFWLPGPYSFVPGWNCSPWPCFRSVTAFPRFLWSSGYRTCHSALTPRSACHQFLASLLWTQCWKERLRHLWGPGLMRRRDNAGDGLSGQRSLGWNPGAPCGSHDLSGHVTSSSWD